MILSYLKRLRRPNSADGSRKFYDAIFYGATPASIVGALALQRSGGSAAIVGGWRERHVGGMMSGGLGGTDILNGAAIGGLTREIFDAICIEGGHKPPRFKFEPRHAERVFQRLLAEAGVHVFWTKGVAEVEKDGTVITALRTVDGQTFHGRVFVDNSYEGDLMARAGVTYVVGRETRDARNRLNGFRGRELNAKGGNHNWTGTAADVDPCVVPGDPSSGFVRGVLPPPDKEIGEGDSQVQAYCFRLIMTERKDRVVHFPQQRPEWFDPQDYELLFRRCQALTDHGKEFGRDYYVRSAFLLPKEVGPGVYDMNNRGPFSTDYIGASSAYPEASYEQREVIWKAHERYIRGFFYALLYFPDPRVPAPLRERLRQFGLDKLNFVDPMPGDEKYWPYQLYVRESRRMRSDLILSGADLVPETARRSKDQKVIASTLYRTDSHHGQRYAEKIDVRWRVWNEGGFEQYIGVNSQAPIPYDIVVPSRQECTNLLVGYCVSATHEAFGAIRMEPTLMAIGEAIGTAAALVREQPSLAVQDVPYDELHRRLLGQPRPAVLPTWYELLQINADADQSLFEPEVFASLLGRKREATSAAEREIVAFNNMMIERDSAAGLSTDASDELQSFEPAGRFRVGIWRGKLTVAGTVRGSESEVYVAFDRRIIKVLNTRPIENKTDRRFWFAFGASVQDLLPPRAVVNVSSRAGLLNCDSGGWSYRLRRTTGNGSIFQRLQDGWSIDKWGQIALPISHKPAWRTAVLDAYEKFAEYALKRFDIQMYLVAGTLLGAVREGDFIAHDDDMDVGYFSRHTRAEDVRDEMFELIRAMKADGWKLRVSHNRGFFQIYAGVAGAKFDVFPAWYEDGYVWMHNSQRIPATPDMMIPPRPATFLGRTVMYPNQPEVYLAHHYGPTWRTPDKHYQETKQPGVLEGLKRARLTPEQAEMLKEQRDLKEAEA